MLFIAIAKVRRETLTDVKSLEITAEWIEKWEGANGVKVRSAYASVACAAGAVMLVEADDALQLSEFFMPIAPYNEVTIYPVVEFGEEVRRGLRRTREQAERK